MGLRGIVANKDTGVYEGLKKAGWVPNFMRMSEQDEKSLSIHKKIFKDEKKRNEILYFALMNFSNNVANWKEPLSGIQYNRCLPLIKKK